MDTTKRIYISGPITNDPCYLSKFDAAEISLIEAGYTSIINPAFVARALPADFTHKNYMAVALEELRQCEAIYLLKGWKESNGAQQEYQEALSRGMEVIYQMAEELDYSLKDIYGDPIYPGERYYEIEGDIISEDNISEYVNDRFVRYAPNE